MTARSPAGMLSTYVARLFLSRFAIVLALLVAVLQLLDLMARADDVLTVAGNGRAEIMTYVQLRVPQLIDRFMPFAAMLASILAVAELAQQSEIIVMRAAGRSAVCLMRPIVACGAIAAAAHILFHDTVVAPASARLHAWESAGFATLPDTAGPSTGPRWALAGRDVIKVGAASITAEQIDLTAVTVYRLSAGGRIEFVARAATAAGDTDGAVALGTDATIHGAARLEAASENRGFGPWPARVLAEAIFDGAIAAEHLTLSDLWRRLDDTTQTPAAAGEAETVFWHRFAGPLASIALPVLGVLIGFGPPRRGQILARLAVGLGLGFAYFVADSAAVSLGKLGALPPLLAAAAPAALGVLGAGYLLLRADVPR
ncbi:MAG: LptF/LptG family permease [Rhodospirillaceae bacterium]|nr:LptF/LptG family permease [Rhodospirillaceae bacterium]